MPRSPFPVLQLGVRVGVHTGKVMGGIIGLVRFHFDMWGNGVSGAVRMEELGQKGQVHVSNTTARLLGSGGWRIADEAWRGDFKLKNAKNFESEFRTEFGITNSYFILDARTPEEADEAPDEDIRPALQTVDSNDSFKEGVFSTFFSGLSEKYILPATRGSAKAKRESMSTPRKSHALNSRLLSSRHSCDERGSSTPNRALNSRHSCDEHGGSATPNRALNSRHSCDSGSATRTDSVLNYNMSSRMRSSIQRASCKSNGAPAGPSRRTTLESSSAKKGRVGSVLNRDPARMLVKEEVIKEEGRIRLKKWSVVHDALAAS